MVLVDGTVAGDTPGWECPREDWDWRPQAGTTRHDDRSGKEASVIAPLEHSVLNMSLDNSSLEELSDGEPLEHSVLGMALDSGLMEGISQLEPLEL